MEYEFTMTLTNRRLDPEIETVFLMADGEYSHVSSSLIKQVARYGGAPALARFVPESLVGGILEQDPSDGAEWVGDGVVVLNASGIQASRVPNKKN